MSSTVIKVENVGKLYRLGEIGTGTLSHDVNRWWAKMRGKEDPYAKVGESNDRASKGESDYVWAVKNVSFNVNQGDVLGIIGRNGAGKSTLLKILSKVTQLTEGSIKVKGRIASLLEVGTGFHPELTGRDNIYLNGAILGMTKHEINSKLDEIVDFSGCERYIDTPVKRYSSGMKVRLGFAVAAHLEPEILIVDEVLAVGDAEFQRKCIGKMQDVSKNHGRTVLFVSHQMGNIIQLCTSCMLLDKGSVELMGDTSYVVEEYLRTNNREVSYYKASDNPKGNAYFEEIALLDKNDEKVNEVLYYDGFKIKMRFKCKDDTKLTKVGIALVDKFKRKVFTSHFDFQKGANDIAEAICEVPGNIIMPGLYTLDAAIFIPNVMAYEYLNDACGVSIVDNGSELTYDQGDIGCVYIDCKWHQ
ncbi:MAG: ABC transporter ATP-binding protein [Bacteroidota bacterium]